ncbi:hypothetical protein B0T14DRAFT_327460 [Immersiella caudata]|uniref:Secreted protein n=1 Tax=Immersiella caudata TaxID=314043 RepID=A0AA39WB27_9PEZI|nr:hypothetical protein B0T14DRAFT_327460 [Immersiella caudata]
MVVVLLLAADCGLGIGTGPRACPSTTLTSVKCSRTPGQQTPSVGVNQALTSKYVLGERERAVSRWCGYREREVGWQGRKLLRELNFFFPPDLARKNTVHHSVFLPLWMSLGELLNIPLSNRPLPHPPLLCRCPTARLSFVDTSQLLMIVAPGGLSGTWPVGGVTCVLT